jgi:hypothetical protein
VKDNILLATEVVFFTKILNQNANLSSQSKPTQVKLNEKTYQTIMPVPYANINTYQTKFLKILYKNPLEIPLHLKNKTIKTILAKPILKTQKICILKKEPVSKFTIVINKLS